MDPNEQIQTADALFERRIFLFQVGSRTSPLVHGHGWQGRWVDHVILEHWLRSLKTEEIDGNGYENPQELRVGIEEHIRKYNDERPHSSPGDVRLAT